MARRKDHTREELKELAVNEAFSIIEVNGLQGFNTRLVAKNIGYTVGTLYQIFKNSDDLLLYVNGRTLEKMYSHLQKRTAKAKDKKLTLALSYYQFALDNRNLWSLLFEKNYSGGEQPEWYKANMNRLLALAEDVFSKDTGKDSKKLSQTLWAATHGITALGISGKLGASASNPPEELISFLIKELA